MLIIGLTGSFGSGKTTVAGLCKHYGAVVIDADAITRALLITGGKAEKKVAKVFGRAILVANKIDRNALAKIVFQDPRELKKLTDILYPIGLNEVKKQLVIHKNAKLIVLDVPLLFESGWDKLSDVNIVVQSSQNIQISRLQESREFSRADILRRIKCQMPLKEKIQRADIVINNAGAIQQTHAQVKAIVHRLLSRIN
ncbi:MAG: dephospho-CoA kinase [Candidatus Omnitrophota bacterium]